MPAIARRNNEAGFTLIELLVVFTLLVMLIGMVGVNFGSGSSAARLKSQSSQLVTLLREARTIAVAQGVISTVLVDEGLNSLHVQPGDRSIPMPVDFVLSYEASKASAASNLKGLFFYPDGSSNGGTLTVSSSGNKIPITVNWLTGEVSIADS